MKTVRPPKNQPNDMFDLGCQNTECEAVIRVSRIELTWHSDVREGAYYSFQCPHCKVHTSIAASRLEHHRTVRDTSSWKP